MNNTSIVNKLKLFADLLELHNGDSFKIKALRNAHSSLRKVAEPIMLMSAETLTQLPGVGKNTSKLILQLPDQSEILPFHRWYSLPLSRTRSNTEN